MRSKNFDLPTTTRFVLETLVDKRYLCIERIRSGPDDAPDANWPLFSLFEQKFVSNRAYTRMHTYTNSICPGAFTLTSFTLYVHPKTTALP